MVAGHSGVRPRPGLLGNLEAYNAANAVAAVTDREFVTALYRKFGDKPFTAREAYDGLLSPFSAWPFEHMGLEPHNAHSGNEKAVNMLGRYLAHRVKGNTFQDVEVMATDRATLVVIAATPENATRRWAVQRRGGVV